MATGVVLAVTALASVPAVGILAPASAHAAAAGGDDSGGTVTVGASDRGSSGGGPGGSPEGGPGGGGAGTGWLCLYTKLVLNDEGGIAPGGPTPGSWYSVTCTDQITGASTTETEWIADRAAVGAPVIDPYAVARQAENSLRLPPPDVSFNPAAFSVVNLPTWLWIGTGIWHSYSITATVGPVSATAVATPQSVSWWMGDGGEVTCNGPGIPFDPAQPPSQQTTACSYTYTTTSDGQPSPNADPDDAAFTARATVHWSVSWTSRGVGGGGTLPPLATSAARAVRVEQVESVNTGMPDAS
jgi:hypothetical protein